MFDLSALKKFNATEKELSSVFYNCFRIFAFCDNIIWDIGDRNTTGFLTKAFKTFKLNKGADLSILASPDLFAKERSLNYKEYSFFKMMPKTIGDLFLFRERPDSLYNYFDDGYFDDDEEDDFYTDLFEDDDSCDEYGMLTSASPAYLNPEYAHQIRTALISEDREFFLKLSDFAEDFFQNEIKDGDVSCACAIDSLILLKLYLNLDMPKLHTDLLMTSQIGSRDLAEDLNQIDDEAFVSSLSDMNKAILSRFSSMDAIRCKYSNISELMAKFVSNPVRYEDDNYYRTGTAIKDDLALIYEHFFKGEFEQCLQKLSPYIIKLKNNGMVEADTNEFLLMKLFCCMMTDTDSADAARQSTSLFLSNVNVDPLVAITAKCISFLFSSKAGKEEKCLDTLVQFFNNSRYTEEKDFIEIINNSDSPVTLKLIIACALYQETCDPEVIKDLFLSISLDKLKLSYPALARRIYNCSKNLTAQEPIADLESEGFFDFSQRLFTSHEKLQAKLDTLKTILKIDEKSNAKKTARTKKRSAAEKHMVWIFCRTRDDLPYPYIAEINHETRQIGKLKDFDIRNFFNSRSQKDYISSADTMLAKAYSKERDLYYSSSYKINVDQEALIKGLAQSKHPYVFVQTQGDENTTDDLNSILVKASFVQKKVELCVKHTRDDLILRIDHGKYGNTSFRFTIDKKNGAVYLYDVNQKHMDLARAIGKGTSFPKEYIDQILLLGQSEDISINADIETNKVQSDPKPVVLIENQGKGYFVSIKVKPYEDENCPYKLPGAGEQNVVFTKKDDPVPVSAARNLQDEKDYTDRLLKTADKFEELIEDDTYSYYTDEPVHILKLLEQLKENSDLCTVKWTSDKKLNVSSRISTSKFAISSDIVSGHIMIDGKVELDDLKYLSLKSLLNSLNSAQGNFIALDDENYVSITSDLKAKLEKLKTLTVAGKKDAVSAHPLAGMALEDILKDMGCQFSAKVENLVEKREYAMALEVNVPKNLNAKLRSYQEEGYSWLYRLSEWGVGACLADDMGLGKTVQTIALMLKLAVKGPVIVVAPTSVCPNWQTELNKFAPSLNVTRLKEAEDREQTVNSLKKGDVLIVSYGLFAIENELLSKVKFELAVYDEAQSLKNSATQRAKSAASMKAKMSVALTGTPIENNLDDLWSIFNIINPGLLGTLKDFHSKFSDIQTSKNTSRILKLLISPFIKRRLKGDVLDDLPPRTEQVITVEPNQKEKELYEALRRKTAEELEENQLPVNKNGQRRLQILAALTKMRQFCCDPALLDEKLKSGASSKTSAFEDLLDEALSGGHRLLVFSQFVGYLSVIRKLLDNKKIPYQYLDGQTPEKARAAAIESFNNGEGDVFLISLKAGGQGLNLTSADYVVHLDPWWNPAVEDQATDRAYRIGQTRPVNVFRLVIKDSLEEKILELHAKKRELAADFLEGTSAVAAEAMKLSEQELLDLIS